jgi:hypothetical protein
VLIYKADFITQISTLIHHGKRFPLSRLDVHLLDIGRKSTRKAAPKHNNLIRFRTEASTIRQRKLQLNLQSLPVTILNRILLDSIESILAVVAPKRINELIINDCCRKSTL